MTATIKKSKAKPKPKPKPRARKRKATPGHKRRPQRGRGQPSKLTPQVANAIRDHMEDGNYLETAAALAGIHRQTAMRWMQRGKAIQRKLKGDKIDPTTLTDHDWDCVDFCDTIETAKALAEADDLATIKRASRRQWQAAAWRLERRNPTRWGRRLAWTDT